MLDKTIKREGLFWDKVNKTESCWEWTAGLNTQGYPVIGDRDTKYYAHRVAYSWYVAPIPSGLFIRHTCDNPICVRPDHLVAGTHQQNMQDMVDRNRHKGNRKLTESSILSIREAKLSGESSLALAKKYDVSRTHIDSIVAGRSWSKAKGPIRNRFIISNEQIESILTMAANQITRKEIQEITKLSKASVEQIITGKRKKK